MSGPRFAGTRTLLYKEVLRFWKVAFQTVAAPVLTAALYLLIFGHVLQDKVHVYDGVGYTSFLVPGLVMMSVLQNAFANSSSSLVQSKITGNLVLLLVTPLSHWAWFAAYVGASVVRGLAVGDRRAGGDDVVRAALGRRAGVDRRLRRRRRRHHGRAGHGGRAVGGEVRPDRRVPELHRHADDVPLRRVLFDPLAAAVSGRA